MNARMSGPATPAMPHAVRMDPWMEARKGYGDSIPSNELLPKERIMKYYIRINQKYGIDTENGLRTYIHGMLDKAS